MTAFQRRVELPHPIPGGAKAAVRAVGDALPGSPFVLRSDVKSDYVSLDHELLLAHSSATVLMPAESGGIGMIEQMKALVATLAAAAKSASPGPDKAAPAAVESEAQAAAHEPRISGDDVRSLADEREPRLYEQAAPASPPGPSRLEGLGGRCAAYVRRWCRWVTSGLAESPGGCLLPGGGASSTGPRRGRCRPATPA